MRIGFTLPGDQACCVKPCELFGFTWVLRATPASIESIGLIRSSEILAPLFPRAGDPADRPGEVIDVVEVPWSSKIPCGSA